MKLALINEILGRSHCGPIVFGCQAPDSGNAEILAHYGTPEQKEKYLEPLLDNEIVSCFSMTEPQGGADPKVFTTAGRARRRRVGDQRREVVLVERPLRVVPHRDGGHRSRQPAVPAHVDVHRPDRHAGRRDHPQRRPRLHNEGDGTHAYIRYDNVRVPRENMLGGRGEAFVVAQTRLGGGRIHHAMRTVGMVKRAFDMMCERAVSRHTQGEMLGRKQMVQEMIADSWIEMEQFRLLVLRTAWRIDKYKDYKRVRADISAVKAAMPKVFHDVAARALQIHGSLGASNEMPFSAMLIESFHMGLADGPTEVHKVTLAAPAAERVHAGARPFPDRSLAGTARTSAGPLRRRPRS